mmetsp:Transcript_7158/g.17846  ORF Transcript_7158/g.17846 Transcript_7158/m.17846 type:complete len:203 (-) Transcript_7158:849-1457(-)
MRFSSKTLSSKIAFNSALTCTRTGKGILMFSGKSTEVSHEERCEPISVTTSSAAQASELELGCEPSFGVLQNEFSISCCSSELEGCESDCDLSPDVLPLEFSPSCCSSGLGDCEFAPFTPRFFFGRFRRCTWEFDVNAPCKPNTFFRYEFSNRSSNLSSGRLKARASLSTNASRDRWPTEQQHRRTTESSMMMEARLKLSLS